MTNMVLSSSPELKIIGFHLPSRTAPTGLIIGASELSLHLLLSLPRLPLWVPCLEKQDQQPASHGCWTSSPFPMLCPLTTHLLGFCLLLISQSSTLLRSPALGLLLWLTSLAWLLQPLPKAYFCLKSVLPIFHSSYDFETCLPKERAWLNYSHS